MSDSADRILDAARRLLDRGDALSVSAVAREAGLARGTVYRLHPSKEALHAAVTAAGLDVPDIRERILDAVGSVILESGLTGMTLGAVANAAGVGEATLYRHFGDRKGLIREWGLERSPRRFARSLQLSDGGDLEGDLTVLAAAAIRFLREHEAILRAVLSGSAEAEDLFDLRANPLSSRAALTAYFDRQVAAGRLDAPSGRHLTATFGGMLAGLAWLARDGDPEEQAADAVRTLLRGRLVSSEGRLGHVERVGPLGQGPDE